MIGIDLSITSRRASGTPVLTWDAFLILSDSLGPGRDNADSGRDTGDDPIPTNAVQFVTYPSHADYQDLITPAAPITFPLLADCDRISPMERLLIAYGDLSGNPVAVIGCGVGGSSLQVGWNYDTPGGDLTNAVAQHNAAMTALKADRAASRVAGVIIALSSNDNTDAPTTRGRWLGLIDYVRDNCDDIDDDTPLILAGPCGSGPLRDTQRAVAEDAASQRINCFVVHPPFPTADINNLHPTKAENRTWGTALGTLAHTVNFSSQAKPTITMDAEQTNTEGDKLAIPITHTGLAAASKYGVVAIHGGADAAEFAIGGTFHAPTLTWASDGTGPAEGDYVVELKVRNGAWQYGTPFEVTVTVAASGEISPATFFSSGQLGMVWDLADTATLFQDVAGTTPVTATGQSVGKVLDKSGNDNHWVAAADNTTRPTYQVDGNGNPYLAFDGSNDILFAEPYVTNADRKCTVTMGLYGAAQASGRIMLSQNSTSNGQPFEQLVHSSGTTTSLTQAYRNDSGSGASPLPTLTGILDSTPRVVTSEFFGSNSTVRMRDANDRPSGGGSGGWTSSTIGTWGGTLTLDRAGLGGGAGGTPANFFAGRIYSGYAIQGNVTDADRKAGEDWVNARTRTSALP